MFETIKLGGFYKFRGTAWKVVDLGWNASIVRADKLHIEGGIKTISSDSRMIPLTSEEVKSLMKAETVTGKRGRPKGSKNKFGKAKNITLAEVKEMMKTQKKRGRPKGSKNASAKVAAVSTSTKKRGRPKGSKNKVKSN